MKIEEMLATVVHEYQTIWNVVISQLEAQGKDESRLRADPTVRAAFMHALEARLNTYDRPEGGSYSLNQADVGEQLIKIGGRLAQAVVDHARIAAPPVSPPEQRNKYASVAFEQEKLGLLVREAKNKRKNLFEIAGVDHTATPGELRRVLLKIQLELHPDKLKQREQRDPTSREQEQFDAARVLLDLIKNNQLDDYRQALGPLLRSPARQPAPAGQPRVDEKPLQDMINYLRDNYQTIWNDVISQLEAQGKIGSALKRDESRLREDPTVRIAFMEAIENCLQSHRRPEGGNYSLNQLDVRELLIHEVSGRLGQVAIDTNNPPKQTSAPSVSSDDNFEDFDPRKPIGAKERAFINALREQARKDSPDAPREPEGGPKPK